MPEVPCWFVMEYAAVLYGGDSLEMLLAALELVCLRIPVMWAGDSGGCGPESERSDAGCFLH
ncbi:MAG: hypothetical protein HKL80_10385 [Acidimicrobiales bacterium]|nr:hypothetical protein [Acidimicrobiales bacterium]